MKENSPQPREVPRSRSANELRTAREQWLAQLETLIAEADEYLVKWRERAQQSLPTSYQRERPRALRPAEQWRAQFPSQEPKPDAGTLIEVETDNFFEWYDDQIVPLREKQRLPRVGAHGTYAYSLFRPTNRMTQYDVEARGILADDLLKGDWGAFENIHTAGGMGGWWMRGEGAGPTEAHEENWCWILSSEASKRRQHYTIVFRDPRTYKQFLERMKEMLTTRKEIPILHTAMRLDQFKQWLEDHQGRLPDEI